MDQHFSVIEVLLLFCVSAHGDIVFGGIPISPSAFESKGQLSITRWEFAELSQVFSQDEVFRRLEIQGIEQDITETQLGKIRVFPRACKPKFL